MCILFFQLNEGPKSGPYRLVLANNRDEYWARPTATAAFWGKDGHCLSSLDKEPGREGGTWIGVTKEGKLGILLNILGENHHNCKGRGFLVSNFLTSDQSAESYLKYLEKDVSESDYNGFHLVTLEVGGEMLSSMVLSEKDKDPNQRNKKVHQLPLSEVHAFGNSAQSRPWQKVVHGKSEFQKIMDANNSQDSKEKMVDDLMSLLNDKTQHFPDPVLEHACEEVGCSRQITQERSACCVWSPSIRYGTRTNTVILVDWEGNCEYIEKSLTTPVQVDDPRTTTETFRFSINTKIPLSKS